MNNRSAFRRLLANRKHRQSFLRMLLDGILGRGEIRARANRRYRFEVLEERRVFAVDSSFLGSFSLVTLADVNASAINGSQTESHISVNPISPGNVVAMANGGLSSNQFTSFSTNAGTTFTASPVGNALDLQGGGSRFDGATATDRFGNVHLVYMARPSGGFSAIVHALSTNGGSTYTVVNNIVSPPVSIDKPWIATGPDAGTPGNEAVLITYRSTTGTILATAASVSGLGTMGAFTAAVTVSDVAGVNYAVPAIGDDGEMVVTFTDNTGGQGLTNIFFDRDLDGLAGGLVFGVDTTAATSNAGGFDFIPATPDRSAFSSPYVAYDRSGGTFDGRLYMTYADELIDENNDTDIFLRSSDNNGATWTAPIQVNDNDGATGNSQFFQNISIDQDTGFVFIGWLDARNDRFDGLPGDTDSDNQANSEVEYFVTASLNGGAIFLVNKLVSDGTSDEDRADPDGNDFGDYTGIAAIGGSAYMAWPDNSNSTANNPGGNATFDIYVDRVRVASTSGQTITATGSAGADNYVIRLDASGTFIQIYENTATTGVPTYTATLASVNNIVVNGNNGNDTLTVDYTNGNPIPAGGINYAGGENVGDNDTLAVKGYNVGTVTVNHLGVENGNVNVAGSKITFSQIEPLALAGTAADLVINLPAGPNTDVSIADDTNANFPGNGLALGNTSAIDASTFEYTSFTNPTNSLKINLGPNGDTATVRLMDVGFAPAGAIPFLVQGGAAVDTVNVVSTKAGVALNVHAGGGLDNINVGNTGVVTSPGFLTPVAGPVIVDGQTGGANLVVDGSGAGVAADYAITSTTVTRSLPAGFGGVTYSNLSTLLLTVGSGANVISVTGTAAGVPTTVNTNAGVDTVNVTATNATGPLTIGTGSELDTINIGNTGAVGAPGLLTPIAGTVTVDGGAGGANLVVDGSGAGVAADYAITSTTVTRSLPAGFGGVTYSNLSTLLLTVGSGANVISVTGTAAGVPTTVNTNAGVDTVNVTATNATGPLTIGTGSELDTINIGNTGAVGAPGLLTPIAGTVTVDGGAGGANLVVDGSGAGVAADYAITSTTVTRSLPAGFGGVTYSNLSTLILTVGSGANVISVNSTAAGVATNIATGAGDDSIVFANGVSLNGGTIDGGANTDTVDYSAYSTSVAVNLGSNAPGGALAGVVDGGQENPGQVTTATGTVSITNYNSATKTFDISAHVSNLLPAAVTGYHIHRAPIGVNGGIIINLTTLFGNGSLIADGLGGFDFNAIGVTLPAQHEAAFLGGITYVNIHTATAPGGLIRGQILPSAVFVAAPGTATGTSGISNIENATGGTGADSLVGDLGVNVLLGNQGNDTIVGAPGNDTMNGGDNNDVLVWSNGDNNDIIDGALGVDVVQVNGSIAGGDNFTVGAAGTRVAFARTNLIPFTLDIGTAETLIVNGAGGDDTETVNSLAGVADLTAVNLFGLNGNDTFNTGFALAPIVVNVNGGSHTTSDTLNVDAAGGPVTDNGVQLSKPGFSPINYTQIENMSIANIGDLTVTGSGLDDTLVVNATSANAGNYKLNAGPVISFTGMTKLTFNSLAGSDALTINNPAVGLFAPTGGIDYNGGGQPGDSLNLLGGGGAGFNEIYFVGTTTPPVGGGGNNGDGLIRFTGPTSVDIRFTGLAPIVDTVAVASLTVNATDAANIISITNAGVAPRVRIAVDAFEPIDFDNKSVVIVNAGDGVVGGDAADTINVNFTNTPATLTGLTINADEGTDDINLTVVANVVVPLLISGGLANSNSAQRDQLNINDPSLGRLVGFDYQNVSNGDLDVTGMGNTVSARQMESVVYIGNNAVASVDGTSGTDDMTVASGSGEAMVFLGGNPWDGPADGAFGSALPGVAGPGANKGPDIFARGLNPLSNVNVTGGGGVDDQLYIYGSSENAVLDPANAGQPVFRGVGLGNGVLIPGRGIGNAYDNVSISSNQVQLSTLPFSPRVGVNITSPANFAQSNPLIPGLIVNTGDEAIPAANGVADKIDAQLSSVFRMQVNGGNPPIAGAPLGDQLQVFTPGTAQVYSDKVVNVTVSGPGLLGIGISSIERTLVTPGNGRVDLIGDNNNPVIEQSDNFTVVGQDVDNGLTDGDADGVNEFSLRINGDTVAPNGPALFFNRVEFLNVFGADLTGADLGQIDTLEITPYADNTPRGWGVATFFDEDAPAGSDGNQADLLIIHTSAFGGSVSEDIVIQPSALDAGEVIIKNRGFGTPIASISYVANTDIIVTDDDGFTTDTDTLTLRGTNTDPAGLLTGQNTIIADFTKAGDAANPVVTVSDGPTLLYRLRTNALAGAAPLTFNTINFETLGGLDRVQLVGRNDGSLRINVDGGIDNLTDIVNVIGTANAGDRVQLFPGSAADQFTVLALNAPAFDFTNVTAKGVDVFSYDGNGGTGSDSFQIFGTTGIDAFAVLPSDATNGDIAVGGLPTIQYNFLGSTNSKISLFSHILLSGGSDTASINGTFAVDNYVWTPTSPDSGNWVLTTGGATSLISLNGFAQLSLDANTSNDALSVATTNAVISPGATPGTGTVSAKDVALGGDLLSLSYANVEEVTITGGTAVIQGTEENDTINVSAAGIVTITNKFGQVNSVNVAGFNSLVINSLGGDDSIIITPSALFAGGISVIGGSNGNGSDSLSLTGADLVVDLDINSVTGVVSGPVSFTGVEHLNATATATITINGKSTSDLLTVTPTGANTTSIVPSVGGLLSIETNNPGSLTIAGVGGTDTVAINGTSAADTITVIKGPTTTVAVGALKMVTITAGTTESVSVNAGDGNDIINVSGTTNNNQVINILGGSPTSNAGAVSDTLNITMSIAGNTAAVSGATPDAGVITSPDGSTAYAGIEFFNLIGLVGGVNTLNSQGTHNRDTMALQFLGGANRIWINDRAVYTFANYATVNLNGLFGDDKINVLPLGLVGVTIINVNGGDPTASDEVVVTGTTGTDIVVIDTMLINGARVTGLGAVVNVATTESLVYSGLGGNDRLTVTSPAGAGTIDFIASDVTDAGKVLVSQGGGSSLIPVSYQGMGITGNIIVADAGGARVDTLQFFASKLDDVVTVTAAGNIQAFNPAGGSSSFRTLNVQTPGVASVILAGLDGDDVFNVPGNHPFTPTFGIPAIRVEGGNPSASDVLNFTGSGGLITQNFSTSNVSQVASSAVAYFGIEILNIIAATSSLTVQSSSGDDILEVTPTDGNSATFRLLQSNPGIGSTPVVNASGIGTLSVVLSTGFDELIINGTTSADNITITGALVTVGALETVNFSDAENLSIFGRQGNDTFTVTPGSSSIFIDGGDPIGVLSGDQLIVNGGVGYFPGPENDEGGILTGAGTVSFDHIESLTTAGIVGCPFLILGTNGDDDITVIARDASTTPGADGVQDFTFSINQGINVVLLNQADLFIDAMAGDDDIVIRTAAPNEAAWDVNVRVAGGSPSIGAPLEADRLVLETPNGLNGFDDIVFNPTGNDTGNLVIDKNANGTYDAAGTDSLITFGSFVMVCPPANFTYTSTAGGVELIQVNGEGAPAIDDNLTINGTALDDTTVINPTGIGTGSFASGASPQFIFQSFDNVTVNPGTGGFDRVEINGTAGPDTVTSNANTVTLGGAVTLGAGIDQVDINTFDGNDNVDLDLAVVGLKKVVHLGAGNDIANLLGVAVDPADPVIYGAEGDDNIVGSPNPDLIYGGSGNDVLIGGAGDDYLYGEDGNDIFGNPNLVNNGVADDPGVDSNFGGAGFDNFVWEPGDGQDINNGGEDAADIFRFFGNANANAFTLRAGGTPTHFNALFGAVNIDNHGIEDVVVSALGGADTITVGDLFPTEVVALNLNLGTTDGAVDSVILNGRALSDNLLISNPAAGSVLVAGLRYNVTVSNAEIADTLTVNGNDGDDRIVVASGANAVLALTLNGNDGNDNLDASTTTTAGVIVFNGGAGRDTIVGGFGDDLIAGGADEDTFVGGPGNDTFDGGVGFDTILVNGTTGNDVINIFQSAATTLVQSLNGDVQTDTLVLSVGTTGTVERVQVLAGFGSDTIQVSWTDALGTDANVNSLRVDVDGGAGSTGDRLGVVDLGTGDLILFERGTTNHSGTMAIGPGNAEPLIVHFADIETAQPIAGAGGDVVVFKHDPFEFNNVRTLATYLGANEAINVDPTINPGLDVAFGFPADEDWYRVVAEKTGVLDFQVYFRQVATVPSGRPGLPNAGNLDIAVTDAAGNVITGFGVNDNSNDERIRIPAIAGQTYYLRVFANGNALNTYNITVDNYVPPTPRDMELLDNPVGDLSNSDTGRSQFDNITRDNTPTLVFRLDDAIFLNDLPGNNAAGAPPDEVIPILFQAAAGAAGYRIAIFDEGTSPLPGNQSGTAPQTPIGFAILVSAGVYQFTTPVLTDGSHFLTARVQMVDPATPQQTGFGDRSVALEIVVDTRPPSISFGNSTSTTDGLKTDSDSGIAKVIASFSDRITNDVTPTIYGSAEANAIIRLFVDRTSNGFSADDILLGQTVARPLDGTDQHLGEWEITSTTSLNSPDLVAAIGKDGVRHLFITAEDVAGNVSAPAALDIMIDTTPAIVTAVTLPNGDSVFQVKPTPRPTPAVNSMTVTFTGGPASAGGFNVLAIDPVLAANVRNYQLVGDHNGNILITSATVVSQSDSSVVVRLNFSKPLPDDRFTLTLDDSIADAANNALDGESQAQSPGLAGSVLPSGNGISGGDFKARFTVDSRPEVGVVSEGIVYVDINGNYIWDPQGIDNDSTNRDLVFQFGQLVDAHFAGNFAPVGAVVASGYDKLGSYGKFAGTYSFVLDTNDDGVADFSSLMPAAYQVNGIPVAGNFNAAHPGDEIGLFDGSFWYLDTNGNNQIDLGERIASNFNGLPIVGDFDGNGTDDLAAFNNSSNAFTFDTNRDGIADFTWRVADDVGRFVGLSGFTDRPVAGDLNLDGIDDIGLWVKDRQGTLPRNSGEYFFWVSDRANPNPALVFDSYSPDPLGNDLFAEFGDELGLPIFGNFDPPVVGTGADSNPLHNNPSPLDVDSDGFISPLDVLVVVNVLNTYPKFPSNDPVRTFYTIGQQKADPDNDRTISPLDALTIINYLNRNNGSGEGEGSIVGAGSDQNRATDDFFAQLGADLENDSFKRKRR